MDENKVIIDLSEKVFAKFDEQLKDMLNNRIMIY